MDLTNWTKPLVLVFSLATLFSMGLGMTMDDVSLALRDKRTLARALLANAVLTPVLAWLLLSGIDLLGNVLPPVGPLASVKDYISLSDHQQLLLLLLALAGGNLLAAALARIAHGRADGSRVIAAIVTLLSVIVVPVGIAILPVGAFGEGKNAMTARATDAGTAFLMLLGLQLAPFVVGFLLRARYAPIAAAIQPFATLLANISLLALLVVLFMPVSGVDFHLLAEGEQSGIVPMAIWGVVLAAGALPIGWLMGGVDPAIARSVGIVTGLRNISAVLALVVFANLGGGPQNAAGALIAYLAMLVVVTITAGEWARKPIPAPQPATGAPAAPATGPIAPAVPPT